MRIAVTGGAGFIGSHLAEKLIDEHEVKILDNFSSGTEDYIPEGAELEKLDVKEEKRVIEALEDVDSVFHFAANPKVNTFPDDRKKDFDENLAGTKSVLEACVENNIDDLSFASSSVVYGEDAPIPTPEEAKFDPISMYGATKCSGEHMCRVYARTFDIDLTILRLANIVGGRNQKGVIYDFMQKLQDDPEKLKILGNGKQKKSYLHIEDTIKGVITAWQSSKTTFNIGAEDSIDVDEIAEIVADEMNVNPKREYTGGERGWTGDVPEMRLNIEKLREEGWETDNNSAESVKKTLRELMKK